MKNEELIAVLKAVVWGAINDAKEDPIYKVNKYCNEDYVNGLNEGYIAGLNEVTRRLESAKDLFKD